MRVLLWTDMDGMSRIADHRECWPLFPQYWQTGRRKFTDEVVAAAAGLLDGGATAVFVVNGRGLGWPNILWDELPELLVPADDQAWARASTRCSRSASTPGPGRQTGSSATPWSRACAWRVMAHR